MALDDSGRIRLPRCTHSVQRGGTTGQIDSEQIDSELINAYDIAYGIAWSEEGPPIYGSGQIDSGQIDSEQIDSELMRTI